MNKLNLRDLAAIALAGAVTIALYAACAAVLNRINGGDDGMNEVASVILACASSAVAGGATGALIQSIRDEAAICRRNRIINNLRRKLNE